VPNFIPPKPLTFNLRLMPVEDMPFGLTEVTLRRRFMFRFMFFRKSLAITSNPSSSADIALDLQLIHSLVG
jgi:hypothetical protein